MSVRGAGGRLRSGLTTRAWLTKGSTSDETIGNRWHFGASFAGAMASTSSDAATLSGAGEEYRTSLPLETLAGGLGLGYGLYCIVEIEGWAHLYPEALADGLAPPDYIFEDAALVIDRSARLGPVIDGDSHFAKAMDFELRLLDCASVRALFGKPTAFTTLTEEYAPGDGIVWVTRTAGFSTVGGSRSIHIGNTRIDYDSKQYNAFLQVGFYSGAERRYPAGTLVTNTPYTLEGRKVTVYVAAIDPSGRYVQGTNSVLDQAAVLFEGYIADRPVRDGTEWVVTVRDQVRKLTDPLGVAASGTAVWTPDDDALIDTPHSMTMAVKFGITGVGYPVDAVVQPFANLSSQVRASELRQAVVDAFTAATTIGTADNEIMGFLWRQRPLDGSGQLVWDLFVQFNPGPGVTSALLAYSSLSEQGVGGFIGTGGSMVPYAVATTAVAECSLLIWHQTSIHGAALAVDLDDGDASLLPATGRIVLESSGFTDYAAYTSVEVDALNPGRVHLQLAAGDQPTGQTALDVLAPDASAPSVRFLWADTGRLADILQRAIVSTGEGRNGLHDTLPRGHGLGLPNIDAVSFERVFGGGALGPMLFQIAADAGTSLSELFDGILRLARRALVTRRRADGRSVEIAAVDVGPVDSGVPVATITDATLAMSQGRRPVRVKSTYAVPQAMKLTCRTIAVGDIPAGEGVINVRDPHLVEWTKTRWDLDLHGLTRDQVLEAAIAWATSWFRAGETRQVLELDVHPRVGMKVQVGDVVALELVDASLWDYAQGVSGYTGLARVLGAVVAPATMLPTLSVACDGVLTAGAMSPSIPIVAVNGSQDDPDSIDVPLVNEYGESYYDLLVAALGDESEMTLLAYRPGVDSGRAPYVVSDVAVVGSVVRLTVANAPTDPVWLLNTEDRLTWPVAASCTEGQSPYLHNTDIAQWG